MEAPTAQQPVFVIQPNSSLSWRGNLVFLAFMAAVCLGLALGFAWVGLWLILPFAGLEITALGLALYICVRQSQHCEVVRITEDKVEVEVGRGRPEIRREFVRAWVQVVLAPEPTTRHRSRLLLRSHGKDFEIGACLPEDERRELARALRLAILQAPVSSLTAGK